MQHRLSFSFVLQGVLQYKLHHFLSVSVMGLLYRNLFSPLLLFLMKDLSPSHAVRSVKAWINSVIISSCCSKPKLLLSFVKEMITCLRNLHTGLFDAIKRSDRFVNGLSSYDEKIIRITIFTVIQESKAWFLFWVLWKMKQHMLKRTVYPKMN